MIPVAAVVGAVAALVFVLAARRTVGADDFAPIAQLWSWWAVCFAAVSAPIQSVVARHAVGGRSVRWRSFAVLGLLFVVAGAVLVAVFGADQLLRASGTRWWLIGATLPLLSVWGGVTRGRQAGVDDQVGFATSLAGENGIRAVGAVVLWLTDGPPWAFAALIPLGFAIYLFAFARPRGSLPAVTDPAFGALASLVVFGLSAHSMLTLVPSLLALGEIRNDELSELFLALAFLRAPHQFAYVLIPLVTVWFLDRRLPSMMIIGGLVAIAAFTAAGWLLGPWGVELVSGDAALLDRGDYLLMALMSGLSAVNVALGVGLSVAARDRMLAGIWLAALMLALAVLAVAVQLRPVLLGITAAELIAFVTLLVALRSSRSGRLDVTLTG